MRRNVDIMRALTRVPLIDNGEDWRDGVRPSFAVAFCFLRDAAFYARKQGNNVKRRRYRRYVGEDIKMGMESLHLALSELIDANPWIVGPTP